MRLETTSQRNIMADQMSDTMRDLLPRTLRAAAVASEATLPTIDGGSVFIGDLSPQVIELIPRTIDGAVRRQLGSIAVPLLGKVA